MSNWMSMTSLYVYLSIFCLSIYLSMSIPIYIYLSNWMSMTSLYVYLSIFCLSISV